jgi:hypothetical protein
MIASPFLMSLLAKSSFGISFDFSVVFRIGGSSPTPVVFALVAGCRSQLVNFRASTDVIWSILCTIRRKSNKQYQHSLESAKANLFERSPGMLLVRAFPSWASPCS